MAEPDYSSELSIESIISAPLVAASKANVIMVTGQTRFLLEYCFEKAENSSSYKPVMIEMVLIRGFVDTTKQPGDPDYIQKAEMTFTVPLLCLVPLNSLAIDKVNIDFDMEITSMISYEASDSGLFRTSQLIEKKVQLNGKISSKQQDACIPGKGQFKSQQSSRLMVNIHAGPLPLPVGVLSIIDLYTKNIQPLPVSESKT